MEGLKLRSFIVAGLMAATAAWAAISAHPQQTRDNRDEEWMKKMAPTKIGDFELDTTNSTEPGASYKSPKMVYDTLNPTIGIVARIYEHGGQSFDVNLIASRDRASFHDPRVCFSAQGYEIVSDEAITVKTKTRGDIPASFALMKSQQGPTMAVYFYRGPEHFYGTTMNLKWALVFNQLKGAGMGDGVFYRFIPISQGTTREQLMKFVEEFMDTAGRQSKGFF